MIKFEKIAEVQTLADDGVALGLAKHPIGPDPVPDDISEYAITTLSDEDRKRLFAKYETSALVEREVADWSKAEEWFMGKPVKRGRGRPRKSDDQKPWIAAGVSRSAWYRERRKAMKA